MLLLKCTQPSRRNDKLRSSRQVPGSAGRRRVTVTRFMINILAQSWHWPIRMTNWTGSVPALHRICATPESFWKTWINIWFPQWIKSGSRFRVSSHSSEHRYQHWYRLQFQFVGASLSPYMQMHSKRQTSTAFCATSGKKNQQKTHCESHWHRRADRLWGARRCSTALRFKPATNMAEECNEGWHSGAVVFTPEAYSVVCLWNDREENFIFLFYLTMFT